MIRTWKVFQERYATRIECWILLFFVLRLIGITNAPLEISHNWRQVTGLMVARNFLEIEANIFYPRIDETAGATGIIGMEFPLLNHLHYLFSLLFDYQHWYGRLINLIVSSFGIFYFYKTVKLLFNERLAFFAAYLLLISSWFAFSRKMMPDTFCVSLMFIALFHGFKYLKEGQIIQLSCFFLFGTLGMLSKIPALFYLIIFIPFILKENPPRKQVVVFILTSILALIPPYYWYFVWCPYLSDTYGQWYNSGMGIGQGFFELYAHLTATFHRFYFDAFSGFLAFGLCVIGLIYLIIKSERQLITYILFLTFSFFIYMLKSGFYFHHHSYYILPFVPIMAIVAGYALTCIKNPRLLIGLLLLLTVEGIANQQHDLFIKKSEAYKIEAESFIHPHVSSDQLIAVNGNGNPQLLYLSHRKGWVISDEQLKDKTFLNTLKSNGCMFILIAKNEKYKEGGLELKIAENTHFVLFAL
jgi:hypothetical protein